MGNYRQTLSELNNLIVARIPLIILDTSERERAEKILRSIASSLKIDMPYYTDNKQVKNISKSDGGVDVNSDPLPYIAKEFMHKQHTTFVMGDVRKISDDCLYARELLNVVRLACQSNSTLIIITSDYVWNRISQLGMTVKLDLPDMNERIEQIIHFINSFGFRYSIEWKKEHVIKAAALMSGFNAFQINNILSATLVTNGGLFVADLKQLSSQKSKLYSQGASITNIAVDDGLIFAGLDNLKDWLERKKQVFFSAESDLNKWGIKAPKGILLVGVPGCGKSLSAKMIAQHWELPLYKFDIGGIFDKWLGESERKMKEALEYLDNVSPCVVWLDELEKAIASSNGSNDVGRHVLGQFLFWLQESTSRVFIVATANDISSVPPELFRKGRFSEIFFVDLPSIEERKSYIKGFSNQYFNNILSCDVTNDLALNCKDFSYADIESALTNVAENLMLEDNRVVTKQDILNEFNRVVPFAITNKEMLDELRQWGRKRAVQASKN